MNSIDTASSAASDLQLTVLKGFSRKQMVAFGVPAVIFLYFFYIFFAFDMPGLARSARALRTRSRWPRTAGRTKCM
jgi:phosphonate transport system permease protein